MQGTQTHWDRTILEQALADVNKARVAASKKPLKKMPKGILGSVCECPIARALRPVGVTRVSSWTAWFSEAPGRVINRVIKTWGTTSALAYDDGVKLTMAMHKFVKAFDDGRFPNLTDRRYTL